MTEEKAVFKEKWYVRNLTIAILLCVCSIFPFAAILVIPLVIIKGSKLKKILEQQQALQQSELQQKATEIKNLNSKINQLCLSVNSGNQEIHNLKGLISPDAKKVVELQSQQSELQSNIDNLKREIKTLETNKKDKVWEVKSAIKTAEQEFKQKEEEYNKKLYELELKISNKEMVVDELGDEIIELRDEVLLQSFALYRPQYDFVNSARYKLELDEIRGQQKAMIKAGTAALGSTDWTVNNDARKGKKMVNDMKKLLLRAFNSECEFIVSKVKYNNFDTCLKRMKKSAETIAKLGTIMNITISLKYLNLKISELRLALEYKQMKQKEKEEQQELRARLREEARVQREIEEERKKVEKEKMHYINAFKEAQKQLKECEDEIQKAAIEEKLASMQTQMAEIDKNLADIDYREANQRAGYVYIISNIGSFGENVYKIGMTRRLNPQECVDELGSASVPFNFDVHAMIFSKDAPTLETALHHAFENKKINMVNKRREFFNVSLDEIEEVVKSNFDGSVDFVKTAAAEQYRESLKIKQQLVN